MIEEILKKRFIFVMGKGGVGKTTMSAVVALHAAQQKKRVLIAMCDAKENLSTLLEVQAIGPHNQTILPNIDAVNMTPFTALQEYGRMVLRWGLLYKAVFENRYVSAFLHATPGLQAWSMLGKAFFHATDDTDSGAARYDLVILDAPATGHGVDMLRVPYALKEIAPPGPLRKEAQRAVELFTDPSRTGVLVVSLPEELPTTEALELNTLLDRDFGIRFPFFVCNRTCNALFTPEDVTQLAQLRSQRAKSGGTLQLLLDVSQERVQREQTQYEHIARLKEQTKRPVATLPEIETEPLRRSDLESMRVQLARS